MRKLSYPLAVFIVLGLQQVSAQTLETTLQTCAQCHGSSGISQAAGTPHLEHQVAGALEEALSAYLDARRVTTIRQHKEVPRDLVAPIARFYNTQKATDWPKQATEPAKVEAGETVYASRCAKCHDDNGRDSANDAPFLAGQDLEYLVSQAMAFKSGTRAQPSMMDRAYKGLSDEELVAVAHYFASQESLAPSTGKKRKRRG